MERNYTEFRYDEKEAILDTLDKVKNKPFTNIYHFFDFRTKRWHIFHHTEQNAECQTGFEEAIFSVLKTLDIRNYHIIMWKDGKIRLDKVFTNTGIYISNVDNNLED